MYKVNGKDSWRALTQEEQKQLDSLSTRELRITPVPKIGLDDFKIVAPSLPISSDSFVTKGLGDKEVRAMLQDARDRLHLGGAHAFLEKGTWASGLSVWGVVKGVETVLVRFEPFNYFPSSLTQSFLTIIAVEKLRTKIQGVLDHYPRVKVLEEKAKAAFAWLKVLVVDSGKDSADREIRHRIEPRVENLVREKMRGALLAPWKGAVREQVVQPSLEAGKTWIGEQIADFTGYVLSHRVLRHLFAMDLSTALVSASLSVVDVYLGHDRRVAVAKLKRLGFSEATLLNLNDQQVQELVVDLGVVKWIGENFQSATVLDKGRHARKLDAVVREIKKKYANKELPGFNDTFADELAAVVGLMKSSRPEKQVRVYEALEYESGSKFNRLAFQLTEVGVAYTFAAVTTSSPIGYVVKSLITPGNVAAIGAVFAGTIAYSLRKNAYVRETMAPRVKSWAGRAFGRIRRIFSKCLGRR